MILLYYANFRRNRQAVKSIRVIPSCYRTSRRIPSVEGSRTVSLKLSK